MADEMQQQDLEKLDKETLIQLLIAANASNAALAQQVSELNESVRLLTEQIKIGQVRSFGRSSEKHMSKDTDGQLSFVVNAMNELEVCSDEKATPDEPEMEEVVPKAYVRHKKGTGKRKQDLSGIEKEIVEDRLTQEELLKEFPDGKWIEIESYTYSRLEVIPAVFKVVEHHVFAYKGSNGKIVKARHTPYLLRNSIITPSLAALLINMKFVNGMPLNRIQQELERMEIYISTPDLCYWVNTCAQKYFLPLLNRMIALQKQSHILHADETPVKVRKNFDENNKPIPGPKDCYMWVYRTGEFSPHPIVVYDFQDGRGADHPDIYLKGYSGVLVTDGYQAYHTLERRRQEKGEFLIDVAGCWVHAKRKYAEVMKVNTKGTENSVAHKAVRLIENIFHEEDKLHDLPPDERLKQRKDKIAPLVDAYFAWIKQIQQHITPKSKTGEAISYSLNQEKYLRRFLTDGEIPMTNNAAERSIRPFTLGRKNWYLIDTKSGAESTAILYSMAETAKANNVKPYEWFKYFLEQTCQRGEYEDPSYLDDLLPWSEKLPGYIRKAPKDQSKQAAAPADR